MKNTAAKKDAPTSAAAAGRQSARASARVPDEENWDQRLGFVMHDVSRLRRIVFDEFMKPLGITRSQWWVIAYLSRHDGMIQSDLANVLELGKAALGGLIDRLEVSGFTERRPDDTDRRVKRVYLTTAGNQLVRQMRLKNHEMNELILAGLDREQRVQLAAMLQLVRKNLLSLKHESDVDDTEELTSFELDH
ncbi:MarR family winged helix-turn-helix transcriptional regulator [Paraburkholderia unamae]|uniref:DNA-binding MarR family transcriptional regulator n=1 Tax=Paraburkholderia unamae TaxID=219649 RepID=A0ABX5KFY0_9BURK|nr:MarR family transcriptional regulator [Paraburkholderia unamae]PVX75651.1 DNA-binding MarR family transcriptional regulator [Paraburkholderia unamae]RAR57854.1 DNA-binding MarR family transcriptional regulator [Paraburkholderia unamae]